MLLIFWKKLRFFKVLFVLLVSFVFIANHLEAKIKKSPLPAGMVLIPAGAFMMGETADSRKNIDESPQHKVFLNSFYIDKYLVTNRLFEEFVNATGYITDAEKAGALLSWRNPSGDGKGIKKNTDYPVVRVSWNDAEAYCKWAGKRLPTEAEFEKAARGGIGTRFAQVDKREDNNWYSYNIWIKPVGRYGPNPYGLYDILGYMWEWCSDWYSEKYYEISPKTNPQGPDTGTEKVLRGGAYWPGTAAAHTAARIHSAPKYCETWTGFRCAKDS